MSSINLDSILKKHPQVRYTIVPEGGLLVLHESAELMTLNPIAIEIFDKIDGKKKVKELLKEILKEYDVEEEKAREDIFEFLKELEEKEIIEVL